MTTNTPTPAASDPPVANPARSAPAPRPRRFTLSRELGLLLLLILCVVIFRILFPASWEYFATFANLSSVVRNMAFEGVLALGMMLMLIGGTFDLSVGATASMVGVVTGWLMKN